MGATARSGRDGALLGLAGLRRKEKRKRGIRVSDFSGVFNWDTSTVI